MPKNVPEWSYPAYASIETAKVSSQGEVVWFNDFVGDILERHPRALTLNNNKSALIVTGVSPLPASGGDIVTLGYDSETGRELWVYRWNVSGRRTTSIRGGPLRGELMG